MRGANLALRFLLELGALAALIYWGLEVGSSTGLKVVLALAAVFAGLLLVNEGLLFAWDQRDA
jgi:hypothetical protein